MPAQPPTRAQSALTQLLGRLALAVIVGALGFWPRPQPAFAAAGPAEPATPLALDVDRTDDVFSANACLVGTDGDCSLRGAIYRANLNPGSTVRLLLLNSYSVSDSVRGRLVITSPMSILGVNNPALTCLSPPCYAAIRASGSWTTRLMENYSNLFMSAVSLRGGNEVMSSGGGLVNFGSARLESVLVLSNTALFDGGGIYNMGALHMLSSTLRGNAGTSPAGDGGALFNRFDGTAWLTATLVQANRAANGGGIYSEGPLTLQAATLLDNDALKAGGGAFVYSSPLTVSASFVLSNTAVEEGGGMNAVTGTLVISDTEIRANAVLTPGGIGGGAHAEAGRITLRAARVLSNEATYGGGLYTFGAEAAAVASIVAGNVAEGLQPGFAITTGAGGAFYFRGAGAAQLRLDHSRFEDNRSAGSGGALAVIIGQATATETLFVKNKATSGGAASVGLGGLQLIRSAVLSNSATTDEGGGVVGSFSSIRIENSTVSGNTAAKGGGGLFVDNSTLLAQNATVANNTADSDADNDGDGGGVALARGGSLISNTIIAGNFDLSPITKTLDCSGTVESGGYNIFGTTAGCAITGTLVGNITGTAMLAPLAMNGSPFTLSHLPLPGSPARDAGDPSGCRNALGQLIVIDQRGQPRPQDGNADGLARCDIGAVEAVMYRVFVPVAQRAADASW